MKYEKTLVSICIPTFNGERFLKEALESIKLQTYKNIEVVVSDDDSNDQTLEIVKTFKREVNFKVSIYNNSPSGIGANWNNCIKKANGEYIKFLFQDDVLFPECVEKLVKIITQEKNIGLVASKRKFIIEGEKTIAITKWIERYGDLQSSVFSREDELYFLNRRLFNTEKFWKEPRNKIGEPSTVLFSKSIVSNVGYFNESMVQDLDFEFYYRILKFKNIAILDEPLIFFRIHNKQASKLNRNKNNKDFEIFERTIYKEFYWLISNSQKWRLFKKYNPYYNRFFSTWFKSFKKSQF